VVIEAFYFISVAEIKIAWEALKKQRTGYLAKLKKKTGSAAGAPVFFRHAQAMSFLRQIGQARWLVYLPIK